MKLMYKKIIYILTLVGTLAVLPSFALAEDIPVSLSLAPAVINQKQQPGTEKTNEISVFNTGTTPVAIKVYAENFEASDNIGGMSFNLDDTKQYSARSWIDILQPNMVIAPKSIGKVTYNISIPVDAEPGGHYAVLFFEPVQSQEIQDESNIAISQRVGSLLFLTVDGDLLEEGSVLGAATSDKCAGVQCSFKTDKFREWGPVPFEFSFANTGNVHIDVTGKIEIFNMFGTKVAELPIDRKTVLPSSNRLFEAKWLREPLLGFYTAKLTINYGTSGSKEQATIGFLAIPWRVILAILTILTILILVLYFHAKAKKRRNRLTPTL